MTARFVRAGATGAAVIVGTATRNGSTVPHSGERWVADLATSRQVLFMDLTRRGSDVTGTGTLGDLTNPGSEPLTLTGMRTADSLTITFRRQTAELFPFNGRYAGVGIMGVLDGAVFVQLAVAFRRR
jgi:hypothetical protein